MRIWTEAAKAAQREAIKRWQPWAKSTGPRTQAGKTRSSSNARKSDRPSIKGIRTLSAALTAQSRGLRALKALNLWQNAKKSEKRTIMMVYLKSVFKTSNQAFLQGILDWKTITRQDEADKPVYKTPSGLENIRMAA